MRTNLALSCGSILLLLSAGCGDDDGTSADRPTSSGASSSPSSATSGAADTSQSPSSEPTGDADSAAFLQRLEAGLGEQGSVHVELRMTGPVRSTAEGDSTYGPDGSAMRLTMLMANLPGGAMEMVVVDGKAYMSLPGVTQPGTFFEVDQSNPAFGSLEEGLSPIDSLAAFEAGLEEVEELGPEDLEGLAATHYRLHVDTERSLRASGQDVVPGLPDTLSYDVWLDADDRMRQLVYELGGTKLTMEMSDWGKEVSIEAPSPADIVDAPPAMGG